MSDQTNKPRLYSLLIGINEYKYLNKPLEFCVNDITVVNEYLSKNSSANFEYKPCLLENSQATRENIISTFETHLIQQAKSDDIVVFYFSGHGGQELAPEYFMDYERDGLLEGIVCHDTAAGYEYKIADKELRYLFHLLAETGCETIAIFDCCHSGENTRLDIDEQELTEKRLIKIREARKIDDFIFARDSEIKQRILQGQESIDHILPQGRHIQMAACQDSEVAFENKKIKHGLFTHLLIKNLEEKQGVVSYFDLVEQIRINMKSFTNISQHPKLYAPQNHRELIFRRFLFGVIDRQPLSSNIYYDWQDHVWKINLGAIHGLKPSSETDKSYQPIYIDYPGDTVKFVQVDEVFATHGTVTVLFHGADSLDKQKQYIAYMPAAMQEPIYVFLNKEGEKSGIGLIQQAFRDNKQELNQKGVFLVEENKIESGAGKVVYQINVAEEYISISNRGDEMALVPPLSRLNTDVFELFIEYLIEISKWNFVKNLYNPAPTSLDDGIELITHLFEDNKDLAHPGNSHEVLHYKANSQTQRIQIGFTFNNHTGKKVHFACIYLDSTFGVKTDFLEKSPEILEARGRFSSISIPDKGNIYLMPNEFLWDQNTRKEQVYLKVIISTNPFNPDIFYSPGITYESLQSKKNTRENTRGFELDPEPLEEWTTFLFGYDLMAPGAV